MCFLAALCWMLAGLAGTVTGFLTSEGRFEQALLAQVRWEALGISPEALRAFAQDTMRYFRGESDRWEPGSLCGGRAYHDLRCIHAAYGDGAGRHSYRPDAGAGRRGAGGAADRRRRPKETVFAGWLRAGRASAADAGRRAGAVGRAGFFLHVGLGSTGRFIPDGIFDAAEPVMQLFPGSLFAEYLSPVLTAFGLTALCVLGLPPLLRAGYRYFSQKRSNEC